MKSGRITPGGHLPRTPDRSGIRRIGPQITFQTQPNRKESIVAKNRSDQMQQKHFEGGDFPAGPSAKIKRKRDIYLQTLRDLAAAREAKGNAALNLMEAMHEEGLTKIRLDGENKFFLLDSEEKVKLKTIPKAQRDGNAPVGNAEGNGKQAEEHKVGSLKFEGDPKAVLMSQLFKSHKAILKALDKAGITNVGELGEFTDSGKKLDKLDGMTPGRASTVADTMVNFWSDNKAESEK